MSKKYFVVNKDSGEVIEVLAHTDDVNNKTFSFANADLSGTDGWNNPEILYTFSNPNKDGEFTKPESGQLDVTGKYDFIEKEVGDQTHTDSENVPEQEQTV